MQISSKLCGVIGDEAGFWRIARAVSLVAVLVALFPHGAMADTFNYNGSFADPNQVLQIIFTLQSPTDISLQTSSWKAGNFDPVLWLFDSLGNQVTKDDDICNGIGCSPINRDSGIQVTALPPGTYTAILSAWDQHFWRAVAAGNPPGVIVTGWSYGGVFSGPPNYTLTMTTSAGIAAPFTQFIFPPSDTGPDSPVLVSPLNGTTNVALTPTLNWTTVTGTNGYSVYIGTTPYAGTVSTFSSGPPFTPSTPLNANTTYYWKVASRDPTRNNTENPSLVSSFTTTNVAPAPPPAPTLVSPGNGTTGLSLTPTLTWNASAGTSGYDVYFGSSNSPPSVTITASLSYTPPAALIAGATYFWKVASRDPNNNNAESASSIWSFSTAQPLAAPTLVSPTNGATGVASTTSLSWNLVNSSAGYMVYLGTSNPPTTSTFATTSPFTPATALRPGLQYFWRVSSRDPNNNNAESLSAVSSFTTAPALGAPSLISPADTATAVSITPSLNWNAVTGSNGYSVYLGTTNPPTGSTFSTAPPFTPASALSPSTTYYWMVASRDPNNNNKEAASTVRSFVTAATALGAPTLVSPTNNATSISTTPTLTWNAVAGSSGYSLYLGTSSPPTTPTQVNGTSFVPSAPLSQGTTYFWMVASRDPNNNNKEAASAIWSFRTAAALAAPTLTAPANNATGVSTTPTLSWGAVTGTAGYSVYFGTTNPPTTSTQTNNTTFVPASTLTQGTTYYWMVASRDPNNNNKESASSVWSFTTTPAVAAPTLTSPANGASGVTTTPTLSWSAVTGTAGYSVYFGTTNPPTTSTQTNNTTYAPAGLTTGVTYYWMVASRDPNNNNKESASSVWSFTTTSGLAAPTLTSPANGATNVSTSPTLSWSAIAGTAGYSVYFGTSNPPTNPTQTSGTTFTPGTLTQGTTYYWMVASRDPNNNNKEAASAVWSFTTIAGLAAPTLTSPLNGAVAISTSPTLSWNAVAGTSGYSVYFGTTNPPPSYTQTNNGSVALTGLTLGTTYYWMVASRDPNNNNKEAASTVWSFSTVPAATAPTLVSPTNGATGVSTGASLIWNTVAGAAGYSVYFGTTNPPPLVTQTSSTLYVPSSPMTQGTTYYWMIASRDPNNNNKELPSPIWSFTVGTALPPPTLIAPANGSTGVGLSPVLTWNAVTGTVGYSVYFGTTNPPANWTQVFNPTFSPTGLIQGTTYYWMVASRDPSNNNKEANSAVWSFTTASPTSSLPAPVQIAPANGSSGTSTSPVLSWNPVAGSAGYRLYLGTTNPPTIAVQTSSTSYSPSTALFAGAVYYWKVSSLDPSNNNKEAPSPIWSFSTAGASSATYTFQSTVRIDHTKVPNTDQANFPFLFNTTDARLKNVIFGGHVNSLNAYDLIFASDAAGTQKLDHEIESYNSSTGQLVAWVRIPNLSHLSDTTIYLLYGNSSINSSQENKPGVWNNGFNAVYHMDDNAPSTSMMDSTGRNPSTLRNLTNLKTTSGAIGNALTFDGSTDFGVAADGPDFQGGVMRTVSMWLNPSDLSGVDSLRILCEFQDANNHWSIDEETAASQTAGTDANTIEAEIVSGGVASKQKLPNNSIATGNWYHFAVSFNGTTPTAMYLNGQSVMVPSLGLFYGYAPTAQMTFGARNDGQRPFAGGMDEIRVASATRTGDWFATEYNNQGRPSTFYSLGVEVGGQRQASAPVFAPGPGTYTTAQNVTISTATAGATIRYTTDGTTPSETVGTIYSGPIAVSASMTLDAIAYLSGYADSPVSSAAYNITGTVATPLFTPAPGTYNAAQNVTISIGTLGASLRYTIDGSTPTETNGTIYSGPIAVASTTTIKAIGYRSGWATSPVTTGTYTITGTVAAPLFSPAGGAYSSAQTITITTSTLGASIRYTTDGSTPSSTTGTLFTAPINVSANTTIKAIAYLSGWTDSAVTSAAYTITLSGVAPPTFNPVAGTYSSAQSVTLTTTTAGASIRYTTDGSTPSSTTGTLYSTPITVSASTTIKAIAYRAGSTDSPVSSAAYTITTAVASPAFNPAGGTYSSPQSVTITTTTTGASIRYTTDGSTPSATAGTLYGAPITVSTTTTIKAIAYLTGLTPSPVVSSTYTISVATSGYGYRRSITISHTAVPNTDQVSFPFLFRTTDPLLKTTANGGHVMSANGLDIIFASDTAGSQKLDFEVESYNATTGQIVAWIRIPVLSHTADTVIYLLYGNANITTSQQNATGVWNSGYTAVYHMADNAANTTVTDSTGRHRGASQANTNTKTTTGQIGSALNFNGSTDFVNVADAADLQSSVAKTVSFWIQPSNLSGTATIRLLCEYTDVNNQWSIVAESSGNADFNTIRADVRVANVYQQIKIADNSLSVGSTYHVVVVYNGSSPSAIYLNGAPAALVTPKQGPLGYGTTPMLTIGARNDAARDFPGVMDEVRVSNAARSADWIKAEYTNQANPAGFYSLSGEIVNAALAPLENLSRTLETADVD